MSAATPAVEAALPVITAVLAPRSRAAAMAAIVAPVPPSWLMPITSPPAGGSSASSNAWALTGPLPGRPAARHPSARMAATPIAACSEVPHPVTVTGAPAAAASRIAAANAAAEPSAMSRSTIRAATAGCAAMDSVVAHGGPGRTTGMGR